MNETLSFSGIENNFSEKNERLVSNEVLVSNGMAIATRQSRLESRLHFLEQAKKLFPEFENVEVIVNVVSVLDFQDQEQNQNNGGDDNGGIHDNDQDLD